jgi:NADP-dependent 3-hydroxy acid dehydrogenase YdfG
MRIAITGTTSGLGAELKNILEKDNEVISINRDNFLNLDLLDLSSIDVLINNAGHSNGGGVGLKSHTQEQWQSIVEINFVVPILLTQKFINENSSGKIVFITSKTIEKNLGGDSVYSGSKAGLSTFISCMRDELKGSKYKLLEIRPGRIRTEFARNRNIHSKDIIENFYDNMAHMSVTEVANSIIFAINSDTIELLSLGRN